MAGITGAHVVPPKEAHRYTMIFLHGRDDDPTQFPESVLESETSAPKRELPDVFPSMKWVFPASRTRETVRFKTTMVQWFDMWSVEDPSEQEEMQKEGLRESISAVIEIIHQEARLVPLSHIFLGGISQGSATAILALLCSEMKLGGFIGLCTWMPFRSGITEIAHKHSGHNVGADVLKQPHSQGSISKASHIAEGIRGLFEIVERAPAKNDAGRMAVADDKGHAAVNALATPVFLSHSKNDEMVPIQNGRLLRDCLEALGMKVTWKEYMDGGHWIYEPEDENVRNGVDDIEEFVNLNSQG